MQASLGSISARTGKKALHCSCTDLTDTTALLPTCLARRGGLLDDFDHFLEYRVRAAPIVERQRLPMTPPFRRPRVQPQRRLGGGQEPKLLEILQVLDSARHAQNVEAHVATAQSVLLPVDRLQNVVRLPERGRIYSGE